MRPLKEGRCQYYSSGSSYVYENFYTSVSKSCLTCLPANTRYHNLNYSQGELRVCETTFWICVAFSRWHAGIQQSLVTWLCEVGPATAATCTTVPSETEHHLPMILSQCIVTTAIPSWMNQSSAINEAVVLFCSGGYLSNYYEFVGVQSCEEVLTLYILIWTLTGLNLVAFFTGILTTAVLGSLKNWVRHTYTDLDSDLDTYL